MALALAGSVPEPVESRLIVVRAMADARLALQVASADVAVLMVLRVDGDERRRVEDLVEGWSVGAGVALERIGPNTVGLRTAAAPPLRLSRSALESSVERALDDRGPLQRDEERRLLALAVAGSVEARRRLIDAYAELVTVLALWLRPPHLDASVATRKAHEELGAIISARFDEPLLVTLIGAIHRRLSA